jgi:hypothetical protein
MYLYKKNMVEVGNQSKNITTTQCCVSELGSDFYPASKNLNILTPTVVLSSRKYDPGCSSRIRILNFYPSRIPDQKRNQRSKRHQISESGSGSATLPRRYKSIFEIPKKPMFMCKFGSIWSISMFLDSQTHSRIKDSQMNADLCADAEHCLLINYLYISETFISNRNHTKFVDIQHSTNCEHKKNK